MPRVNPPGGLRQERDIFGISPESDDERTRYIERAIVCRCRESVCSKGDDLRWLFRRLYLLRKDYRGGISGRDLFILLKGIVLLSCKGSFSNAAGDQEKA